MTSDFWGICTSQKIRPLECSISLTRDGSLIDHGLPMCGVVCEINWLHPALASEQIGQCVYTNDTTPDITLDEYWVKIL